MAGRSGGTHLRLEERERLAAWRAEGLSLQAIARQLGRAASTISRELRRNALPRGGYLPVHAEGCYVERRQRPAILEEDQRLGRFVRDRLLEGWTPEQIAGWLKRGEERGLRPVATETIYAFLHRAGQKAEKLWRLLPRGRARRGRRRARQPRNVIAERRSIHDRPEEVGGRREAGHWEGDLLICRRTRPVLVLKERKTVDRGAIDRARGPPGWQVRGRDRGRDDGGVPPARPAAAVLDHPRQRHRVRPARPARQRLRHDDVVLRRVRLLAERGGGERQRAAAPRPASGPRPRRPGRCRAARDHPQPQPDASEVPRLPHPAAGAARGAWQGRPDPLRLARCASSQNPPMLGGEVEDDAVTGIAQERLPTGNGLQDAALALDPEILVD